ncbi:MAG: molybdopterin-dependent oxidoreductase [Chloroflexi bacterium]|nr:molybdopterin-dependent oxidoreductase [Chloroflexota bacterium]
MPKSENANPADTVDRQPVSRRAFLKGVAATTALGAAASTLLANPLKPLLGKAAKGYVPTSEKWVPTTCWIGKQECSMLARVIDGRIVKLEGHPDNPRNRGRLCPKGVAQIMAVYDPYRLKAPLLRTNEKGVSGQWKEISWDEALTLVGDKIKEVRAKDPKLLIWQKGRSKTESLYDNTFVKAVGATKMGHGAYCSDAGYRGAEYTIGGHGVLHPDFRHTKYLLAWGWNASNGGGNKFCWITWNRQFLDARERGLKVVSLDPWRPGMGTQVDDWLPNRPGSDLAFFLALGHQLIKDGYVDKGYLTSHTNSPFLVKEDGLFLKVEGKEQVWDTTSQSAKPYDAKGIVPALEGEFNVGDTKVKTSFQVYKEHIAQYTPEWAADVCGLPAESIRKVAQELGQNAMIGSKVIVDGVELPYRPVSIMAYHVAQQELGFQAVRAAIQVFMLLGAMEAVGGVRIDSTWKEHANFKSLDAVKIKDPPYDPILKSSKYFPINSGNPTFVAKVVQDPAKYGVNWVPEAMIIHMANPIVSFVDTPLLTAYLEKLEFIAVIDPFLSETADLFADVVLPAATIEKYEGPMGVSDTYEDAQTLRVPPMAPLFQSRGEIEIYMDLCEKAGVLYGKGGYLDLINNELKLADPHKLDLTAKPIARDIFDRWAKSAGIAEGVAFFETKGVLSKGVVSAKKYYGFGVTPPFGGIRHRLYGESLLRYRNEMKAKSVEEIYWQDYTALPMWREPTMDKSPSQYDLYLISGKKIEFKQSRASFIPLLKELAPQQRLQVNPGTAQAKGINDGDEVWMESQNAITGETRKLKVTVSYVEGLRPDTVFMPHHYGKWVHPEAKGQGPTPNSLYFGSEGYVGATQDASFQVKVRVYKE